MHGLCLNTAANAFEHYDKGDDADVDDTKRWGFFLDSFEPHTHTHTHTHTQVYTHTKKQTAQCRATHTGETAFPRIGADCTPGSAQKKHTHKSTV